jgi:glycosyltransferase involved in cell wall biosynthesis
MKPLVSVLIPAYNVGEFIDASIASALAQSLDDMEVIVVNDGSTDDTADRLKRCADPRLRVITQPHQGLASAYNTAIRAARGVYVGFLDGDDVWLPEKLARHIRFLEEHPGVDLTFSWVQVIDRHGRLLRVPVPYWRGAVSFSQLLADHMIRTVSAVVMRRAAIEQAGWFDASIVRCVDVEFFLRVARLRPDNFHAIPEVLTLYRRHATQRTRDWRLMREGWNQVLDSVRRFAPRETAAVERLASSNKYRHFAALAYESGDYPAARRLIGRSFALSPITFLRDTRNWKVSAAVVAGLTLPTRLLCAVEKLAGFDRST